MSIATWPALIGGVVIRVAADLIAQRYAGSEPARGTQGRGPAVR